MALLRSTVFTPRAASPTGYGAGNYRAPLPRSRATNPANPAYRPPQTPAVPQPGAAARPAALPSIMDQAHTLATRDVASQLGALPQRADIVAPYERQVADIKGLTNALVQHLQTSGAYQASLAQSLPSLVQGQEASIAQQAQGQAGIVGGVAPPAASSAGTLASLGTSFANQIQSQIGALPMAGAANEARVTQNEQNALGQYLLQPTRDINAQLPRLEQGYSTQLQGQANADRSFNLSKQNADRSYRASQAAARERVREFNVSDVRARDIAKMNAAAITAGITGKAAAAAADRAWKAGQNALDRASRVKLKQMEVDAATARFRAAQNAAAQKVLRQTDKEGAKAYASARNRAWDGIDSALGVKTGPGTKTEQVVGYTVTVRDYTNVNNPGQVITIPYGPNWDGKSLPAGYRLVSSRPVTKSVTGAGKPTRGNVQAAINRGAAALSTVATEQGLTGPEFTPAAIRRSLEQYAGLKRK